MCWVKKFHSYFFEQQVFNLSFKLQEQEFSSFTSSTSNEQHESSSFTSSISNEQQLLFFFFPLNNLSIILILFFIMILLSLNKSIFFDTLVKKFCFQFYFTS